LDFVGLSFKERIIEFFLAASGFLFYHLILRPIDYWKSWKKGKAGAPTPMRERAEKNFAPSAPSRIEIE
jgi:hypothetical protein